MTHLISRTLQADLVVIGGGTAGLAAAVTAARRKLKVLLVEQHGFCGGLTVYSMVHVLDGVLAQTDFTKLAVGGVAVDVLNRLQAFGAMGPDDNPPETPVFHPEGFKLIADEMLAEAGVNCLYHTRLVDTETRCDRITAAILHSKAGFWRVEAPRFIDASGDGDLCAQAGAAFELGKALQPMTLHFQIAGLRSGLTWKGLETACHNVLAEAYRRGEGPRFGGPWILRIREGEISLNCTRLYGNALDPVDLTAAEVAGRRNAWWIFQTLRARMPEFTDAYFVHSGPSVGCRETRRIIGDYQLTESDVLSRPDFTDTIGLGAWPMDVHPSDGRVGFHPHKEIPQAPYRYPLRALLPRSLENVLAVGRCASTTAKAHGSSRVNGTSMMMGEAAGVLSALAQASGSTLRDIPVTRLQQELMANGAVLDPHALPERPRDWTVGRPVKGMPPPTFFGGVGSTTSVAS
jgi:hypothetical protein